MKVFLTGAAGFIGSNLAMALLARGDQVLGVDNLNDFYDPALKRKNLDALSGGAFKDRFTPLIADIRDGNAMSAAMGDFAPDAVIHLAAYAGVRPSIQNPALYYDVNLMGTVRLLDAMVESGVKRLVFASSSSVYGNSKTVPFLETDPVDTPISPYAATKKAGELLVHTYHALHGLSAACLRFFTVYGPGQRPDLAICKFVKMMRAGEKIPMYGDGDTYRDYTYIDDIVSGVIASLDWTANAGVYEVFNLGESHTVALRDMIRVIGEALGVTPEIEKLPMQPGDVKRTYADVTKAREMLGYNPGTSFEEGIQKYIQWLDTEG